MVPIPKPRGLRLDGDELDVSERCIRRAEKKRTKAEEDKRKRDEKQREREAACKSSEKKLKKKKASEEVADKEDGVPQGKCIGSEVSPDFSVGLLAQRAVTSSECIWDAPITYELQVDIMHTLHRLIEHFSAAALSIQQSRSFDAVCIVVPGCIAAIADAVMRKLASNEPSEICSHLMGRTVDGRQLGKK